MFSHFCVSRNAAVAPPAPSAPLTRLPAGTLTSSKGEVPGEEAVVADLVDRRAREPGRELAARLLHDQRGEAGCTLLPRLWILGAAQQLDEVGRLRVADPALVTGDDVVVAVQFGAGC